MKLFMKPLIFQNKQALPCNLLHQNIENDKSDRDALYSAINGKHNSIIGTLMPFLQQITRDQVNQNQCTGVLSSWH